MPFSIISSYISFDEELELKDYIDKDLCDQNLGTKYKLFGINIREGTTKNFGHCYSYVKVNEEWICYNDCDAHKEKPSFTLNSVVGLYYIIENIFK
jgi:ubiquitin C-terminal hydrolase